MGTYAIMPYLLPSSRDPIKETWVISISNSRQMTAMHIKKIPFKMQESPTSGMILLPF